MITREQLQQQLDAMRRQEAYFAEQLTLTRGAVQMLEHLLKQLAEDTKQGAGELAPHEERL